MGIFEEYEAVLIGIGEEFENHELAIQAYNNLANTLGKKNYFIVSMCMDDFIFQSELNEKRIVAPLGGNRKKQCPDACTNTLYDNDMTLCPNCGKELVFNNYRCENYVEEGYLPQWEFYKKWLTTTLNRKLLVLEMGVSLKLPQVIRFPFEKTVMINQKSKMLRVNAKFPQVGEEISSRSETKKESAVEFCLQL